MLFITLTRHFGIWKEKKINRALCCTRNLCHKKIIRVSCWSQTDSKNVDGLIRFFAIYWWCKMGSRTWSGSRETITETLQCCFKTRRRTVFLYGFCYHCIPWRHWNFSSIFIWYVFVAVILTFLTFGMEAELMCGVCLEYFDKPLMLPCTHNFCKKCIEGILSTNSRTPFYGNPQLHQTQRPKYHLDCPLCQRSIDLERGVDSLTQNRILENIIALHRKNEPLSSNEAAWKLDTVTTDSPCLLHDSEPMSLYCLTCNRAVCKLCECVTKKSSGASHKCVPVREQADQYQVIYVHVYEFTLVILPWMTLEVCPNDSFTSENNAI